MTGRDAHSRIEARRVGSLVGVAVLVTGGMAVSTVLQFAIGALAPHLMADLGLSRVQLGAITTVFYFTAAALSPLAGAITDRVGGRRSLALLFLVDAVAFIGLTVVEG